MIIFLKRTIRQKSIRELPNFEIGCWINVVNPSPKEIKYLVKKFRLDKRNLESGLDTNEIPRLDFVEDATYIFTNVILEIQKREVDTYLIVIGNRFILTLSKTEPDFIKKILGGEVEFITTQKLKCLIKLFFLTNNDFERATVDIVKAVQARRRLSADLKEKELNILLEQENILNNFVSSYYYMNLLYERILRRIKFFEQDKEIIEDLTIEANQGFNLCKSSLKTLSNIRNYYVVLLSNKLNKIITILTIFTILVSFPAAISGIYGMNVALPLQRNPLVFYYLLLFMGGAWISFILYLKKKRIL